MQLGNILKSCGLLLLCSVLCTDFSVASNGSLQDEDDTQAAQTGLLLLPGELLLEIALKLDEVSDVLSFGATCRTLCKIGNYEVIWQNLSKNLALLPVDDTSSLTFKDRVREHFILMDMRIAFVNNDKEELAKLLEANSKFCRIRDLVARHPAREINDLLCKYSNLLAIATRWRGLQYGNNVYAKNQQEAKEFWEQLVAGGDQEAIEVISKGSANCGSKLARQVTRKSNEQLVEEGDQTAIHRKFYGLLRGINGYETDTVAAINLNERLVAESAQRALERKFYGHLYGCNGYDKDLQAAIQMIKKYRVHLFELRE